MLEGTAQLTEKVNRTPALMMNVQSQTAPAGQGGLGPGSWCVQVTHHGRGLTVA